MAPDTSLPAILITIMWCVWGLAMLRLQISKQIPRKQIPKGAAPRDIDEQRVGRAEAGNADLMEGCAA
jgi:hypothetical protein